MAGQALGWPAEGQGCFWRGAFSILGPGFPPPRNNRQGLGIPLLHPQPLGRQIQPQAEWLARAFSATHPPPLGTVWVPQVTLCISGLQYFSPWSRCSSAAHLLTSQ